jgi:peptide/nickel transport system permease protein
MAIAAFVLAPSPPAETFPGYLNAPPTGVHVRDAAGKWHAPFIYPLRLANQLEQRYEIDDTTRIPLAWFTRGHLVESSQRELTPLLLLGTDTFGHDVFSRLLFGGRISLALSIVAALGAVVLGAAVGGTAGYAGGFLDDLLMRGADFVIVLPATYVALALRSALPLVLSSRAVFAWLAVIFAVLGAPIVARGVRATVRSERGLDYTVAAVSLGSSHSRILLRHLLPAARGFLAVQMTLLVPAFILAEATLSYVGFGFPDTTATWGTMLREAASVSVFVRFPWLLTPGIAIFLMTLGVNLWLQDRTGLADRTRYN